MTDMSNLAMEMLEWERLQRQADVLKAQIVETVLQLKKTQTVGNVRATYSRGRKSFGYQVAAEGHPMVSAATVKLFTSTAAPRTNWRKICNHAGITEIPFTQGAPSVNVKLADNPKGD